MSLHGLLLVDKPQGLTSHDVVSRVRQALKTREVGHSGTLDPLASGLMVLLLGEGTKLSDYILNGDKAYRVRVKLGIRTDSLDITGRILTHQDVTLDPEAIVKAAMGLQGEYQWQVPLYSAVKTDGKKLYEYAHNNQTPAQLPTKFMNFWNVEVLSFGKDFIEAHIWCSKGSYIRTWAFQLGETLGVGGVVETLERTISTPYHLTEAVSLVAIEEIADKVLQTPAYIPLGETLPGWPTVTVCGKNERLLNNGQVSHDLGQRLIMEQKESTQKQKAIGIKIISAATGRLLSILEAQPNRGLKIRRVFKMT